MFAGSSACATQTERSAMSIVRRSRADIDEAKVRAELSAGQRPNDKVIERQASEDGDAWSDVELAEATLIYPTPSPEQIKALRKRLGFDQKQLARALGISLEDVLQYERGQRRPTGPEAVLLRVIIAEPRAVIRALKLQKAS
jgi:DNA-binding transcriptional regulator YiaG